VIGPTDRRVPGRNSRLIRPYVLTRGRTRAPGPLLALEATVRAIAASEGFPFGAPPESRRIVELCTPSMSLAEVAARMLLPIGVVRVLIGDLASAGAVLVYDSRRIDAATDIRLLERLLDGIRAL
jgi:hypothetical protein